MATIAELLADITKAIDLLEKENAELKAKMPPTGIVQIVIKDVDMSKVTFT